MNRRIFLRGLSAIGLLPAFPVPVLAAASVAPAAAPPMTFLYPWAAIYARSTNACSPLMLMQRFNVSPQIAADLYTRLQASGIIGAPSALGLSQATKPHYAKLRRGIEDRLTDKLRDSFEDAIVAEDTCDEASVQADAFAEETGGPVRIRT